MPGLQNLIKAVGGIVSQLIVIMIAAALLIFFWGLAKSVFKAGGDEKTVAEGRNLMVWGLIALFVMVSVWGLVWFVNNSLGIPQGGVL